MESESKATGHKNALASSITAACSKEHETGEHAKVNALLTALSQLYECLNRS